jgi:ABC-type Fe3+/spermidine/putrescine transport system ATPase subunit
LNNPGSGLELVDISKSFYGKKVLQGVSFQVPTGQVIGLIGPSGSGKSTLLNIVAGLEIPDTGDVLWNSQSMLNVPVFRRNFGFMFQDYMLFPHLNVYDNVAFGLKMSGAEPQEIARKVSEMLELVGLPGYEKRDVSTLSGGEQQRVALARALAPQPRLLLLDEPLGALDRLLRERLALDLRVILNKLNQTAMYVTHDQEEAFLLSDFVVLINQGKIAHSGKPQEIYLHPKSEFVARFLGLENIFSGMLTRLQDKIKLETPVGTWTLPNDFFKSVMPETQRVKILLRPDAVQLEGQPGCGIYGHVLERTFRGSQQRIVMRVASQTLVFEFPSQVILPEVGSSLAICFDPTEALQILGDETEAEDAQSPVG